MEETLQLVALIITRAHVTCGHVTSVWDPPDPFGAAGADRWESVLVNQSINETLVFGR